MKSLPPNRSRHLHTVAHCCYGPIDVRGKTASRTEDGLNGQQEQRDVRFQEDEMLGLAAALNGIQCGLALLPRGSVWITCLKDFQTVLAADVEEMRELAYPERAGQDDPAH
jgi:hypothetical protein